MSGLGCTTYDRPVKARLVIKLENGEEWEATQADLDKFKLVGRLDAYSAVCAALKRCGMDTDRRHASLRYVIERTLAYVDLPVNFDDVEGEDYPVVREVRRGFLAWPHEELKE
jgi:hypothetical protein